MQGVQPPPAAGVLPHRRLGVCRQSSKCNVLFMRATQRAHYALLGVVEGFASALRIEVGEEVATFDVAADMLEIAISVVVVLVDVVLFVAVEKGQHLIDGGGFFEFADFHNISFWVFG